VPIHILPGFTATHSNAEAFNGLLHQLHISLSPQVSLFWVGNGELLTAR
jgi:hypothetical protein